MRCTHCAHTWSSAIRHGCVPMGNGKGGSGFEDAMEITAKPGAGMVFRISGFVIRRFGIFPPGELMWMTVATDRRILPINHFRVTIQRMGCIGWCVELHRTHLHGPEQTGEKLFPTRVIPLHKMNASAKVRNMTFIAHPSLIRYFNVY